MKTTKYNMVAFGIVLISLSTAFLAIVFSSVITQINTPVNFSVFGFYNGSATTLTQGDGITLFITVLFLSMFIHAAGFAVKQSLEISNKKSKPYETKHFWWAAALFFIVKDSIKMIFSLIIAVPLMLIVLSMTISMLFMNQLVFDQPLLIFIMGIVAYLPTQIVIRKIGKLIMQMADKNKATYSLTKTGFDLQFNWIGLKQGEGKFYIDFSELDTIETMTFFEAQKYEDELGPNVKMALDQAKSMYKMKETRPTVLFQPETGTNTLIKGPEIHYLYKFRSDQDMNGLIKAFDDFKKK
jgi:hypothetical protein